jgi:hypothetical protein
MGRRQTDWNKLNADEKIDFVKQLSDIREGIGMPVKIGDNCFVTILKIPLLILTSTYKIQMD